ncbi:MAG: universal stress protein [Desulfobacterales bacterium]|nr:universal stress protein [Desulfobacterales bacterium]
MEKKILLPVADCMYSDQAVKYAARICFGAKDVNYTLFNVQPLIPEILIQEANTDARAKAEVNELVRSNREAAQRTVEKYQDLMLRQGISEDRINTVTEPRQLGMAKDILNLAERGRYDAILLGRRGLARTEQFFIGPTAAKVIEHALEIPVWVIDGESTSMKILLAVDGSDNSLRVVDYVVSMVGSASEIRLTLFHVVPYLRHYYGVAFEREKPHLQEYLERGDKHRMEKFYEEAHKRLNKAGLKEGQIEIKTNTRSYHISTAILDEAREGGYGTVVIGRRGTRKAFFIGGAPMRLVHKISNQALWVVP